MNNIKVKSFEVVCVYVRCLHEVVTSCKVTMVRDMVVSSLAPRLHLRYTKLHYNVTKHNILYTSLVTVTSICLVLALKFLVPPPAFHLHEVMDSHVHMYNVVVKQFQHGGRLAPP